MPDSIAQSVYVLLERTAGETGSLYLRELARGVADALDIKHVLIARRLTNGHDGLRARTWVHWNGETFGTNFECELSATPYASVMEGSLVHFEDGVQRAFPDDLLLQRWGIRSFFGVPLMREGRCVGALMGLHDEPRRYGDEPETFSRLFGGRAAAEMEREEALMALRRSEARYRQFVNECAEGVWSIDAQGRTDYVNQQMACMLGLEPADMLGRPFTDFMDEEARRVAANNMARRREGVTERHAFRLTHRDGHDVFTEMATNPIQGEDGQFAGALALVTDLTEQIRLQESNQQKQKLESLGLLAGGVAHDFNNLLVGILGNADVALAMEGVPEQARHVIEQIQRASLHAAGLTKELLACAGRSHFRAEPLDLRTLLRDVEGMLRVAADHGTLIVDTGNDEPVTVCADRGQLVQVLINLVANASDALDGQTGSIEVVLGLAHPGDPLLKRAYVADSVGPGSHAWVRVADTGVGMSAKTVQRVFDPFFTTKSKGHGLGLAAVLGILQRHHGGVVIDTALGEGSAFTLLLPLVDATEEAARTPAAKGPAIDLNNRRVLVTDDEQAVRFTIRQLLELHEAVVDEAESGEQALELLADPPAPYDLILLDLTMPGLHGAQVLARMRERGLEVPVILMSGYSEADLPHDARAMFVSKPFRSQQLLGAIAQMLG